jgi:aminopeptidase N
MEWDESTYDREYDLDVLNIVVMRSYPGGAMENKGLNLYTTEAFLASIDIVRDDVLRRVQAVVAHEYFHNWSGNRVGCRDWFELSLKEGFTIFRHQQFMATLVGKDVARIDEVIRLREYQFPEDEGGMAHAVRPSSYLAINNFYTCTVYEKGAELIRMMKLIVGEEVFRRAAVEFFTRFDGRAVTIDEMIDTIAEISGEDLTQFRRWYDVIGGLAVYVDGEYDAVAHRFTLHIRQQIDDPAIPALHLPMRMGLLGPDGKALRLQLVGETGRSDYDRVIELRSDVQTLMFENVPAEPVPSLFRGFSAPVRLFIDRDEDELVLLATHDGDVVNRWDAAQQLAVRVMLEPSPQKKADLLDSWLVVFYKTLENAADNLGVASRVLQLPSERRIGQQQAKLDVDGIHASRISLARKTAQRFRRQLRRLYRTLIPAAKEADALEARRMRNLCLWYLMQQPDEKDRDLCVSQFAEACGMEDRCAALQLLVDHGGPARSEALQQAYDWWQKTPSMLDQWFAIQAASEASDCVNLVERLTHHPDYSLENATRLKAIFDVFAVNQSGLHHHSGEGYRVIVRLVMALNRSNPRLGARFLKRLDGWRRLDGNRRRMVSEALRTVLETRELAPDLYEIASQSLDQGAQH